MSAYLCNPIHIAMLTRCMTAQQPRTHRIAVNASYSDYSIDTVAVDLAIQNYYSVVYHYGQAEVADQYETSGDYANAVLVALRDLSANKVDMPLSRQTGLLSCYEYQACETPLWRESDAYKHCQKFRRCLFEEMAEELAFKSKRPIGWDYSDAEYRDDLVRN